MQIDPATLDSTTLGIYRAYACALVQFFLSEPGGTRKTLQLLEVAPTAPPDAVDWMSRNFPAIGKGGVNLAKWWSLSLAKLSASDRYTAWSGTETNSALEKILVLHLNVGEEKKTFTLDDYAEFNKLPARKQALELMQTNLLRLSLHAHPLFRPVVAGYQDVIVRLQGGRYRGIDAKLSELTELRGQISQRLQEVGDYLTWFEASQVPVSGPGEFDSYLNLMQSFRLPRPPSREPIGRYLDAMENEMK